MTNVMTFMTGRLCYNASFTLLLPGYVHCGCGFFITPLGYHDIYDMTFMFQCQVCTVIDCLRIGAPCDCFVTTDEMDAGNNCFKGFKKASTDTGEEVPQTWPGLKI